MNKQDMIAFFDHCAPSWDEQLVRSDEKIEAILDAGGIAAGKRVLDVACGTGVLFPDYLARNVRSIVGVDISPEMARIAAEKFEDPRVQVLCGDVQALTFEEKFDCVMVYNAFPHFSQPDKLIAHLAQCLLPGGRLTIAHGKSRAEIDSHHRGHASSVSIGLMHEDALAALFSPYFKVDITCSDEEKYIVSGEKP